MTQTLHQTQGYEDSLNFFEQYAAECLRNQDLEVSEALKRRQIPFNPIPSLEESYKISLKIGDNITLKSIQKPLLQQIKAAADFIGDFQIGVLGQRISLFQLYEIEILIDQNIKYCFTFESGKLLIQIPIGQIMFLSRYLSYQEMKNRWYRGRHLPSSSPARRVWWLFNPIGEFRSNVRTMLLLAAQRQILGINKQLAKLRLLDMGDNPILPLNAEYITSQSLQKNALAQATLALLKETVNEDKLGVNLEQILNNQEEDTLVQLLDLFKNKLADPGQLEEFIDAVALRVQEVIHEEHSQINVKMFGFVNVGNYHRIDVALNLSEGYFKKYVELVPRKAEIKAIQFGFVNVYTIDDITVKPNFYGAMTLNFETAVLERALKELGLI